MLLCERDLPTATELQLWADQQDTLPNCGIKIWPDDWRLRFHRGIAIDEGLTLFSFDPDMLTLGNPKSGREMTPADLKEVAALIAQRGECIVQLSTYSSGRGQSRQSDVEAAIAESLSPAWTTAFASIVGRERIL